MKGRKPKSIEQREREGNAGNRSLPDAVRTGSPDDVVAPAALADDAQAMWDELEPRLSKAGVLDPADAAGLYAMCVQWGRAQQASRVVREQGMFSLGSTGQMSEHPAIGIERAAHQLFIRYAEQFGLSPVARARVAAAVQSRLAHEELDGIVGGGPLEIEVAEIDDEGDDE